MTGESLRDRFAYLQYSSMERVAARAPEWLAKLAFRVYGGLTFRGFPELRATVAGNLSRVLGRPPDDPLVQAATREAFALYARYWYETFHLRVMTPEEVNKRFVCDGIEIIDRALEAGRGAILALPHLGNWDAAGRWLCINGYRLAAVAEQLRPRRVFELFLRHREALGMRIIPLTKTQKVGEQLVELLADNWLVALVADRDLTGRGVEVEMFGAPRKLPAGPALLSLTTGSPLMVCPVYTTDEGWVCRIGDPLKIERTGELREDVTALTRLIGAEFERAIAARPTDWHMFQPAWDAGPAPSGGGAAP